MSESKIDVRPLLSPAPGDDVFAMLSYDAFQFTLTGATMQLFSNGQAIAVIAYDDERGSKTNGPIVLPQGELRVGCVVFRREFPVGGGMVRTKGRIRVMRRGELIVNREYVTDNESEVIRDTFFV